MENKSCNCGNDNKIVITCSGAADVGYVSDQVARKLSRNNHRKMSCLALFATCDDEKINDFKEMEILVIDGCSEDCGKKVMQNRRIDNYSYLRITDLGFEKGKTTTSTETVQQVYDTARAVS